MQPPSVDIKNVLVADEPLGSGGLVFGANLHVSAEPMSPDSVFTLYDTGGFDPDSGSDYQKPTIQIRARGNQGGVLAVYADLKTIADHLHATVSNLTMVNRTANITGSRYIAMWQQGDIITLGTDKNTRPLYAVNFRIHRTPTS